MIPSTKHQAPSTKHQAPSTKHFLAYLFLFLCISTVVGQDNPTNPILLGNKLNNPYNVSAMQQALASLQNKKPNLHFDLLPAISATHYYLRYKPANETELDLLRTDTITEYFDYPFKPYFASYYFRY